MSLNRNVGADSSSCLPACPGSHTLQREATPAQHSRPCTSCTMMAQKPSGRPHRQLRTDGGSLSERITRKRWGEIVVSRLVGATVSAAPAPTPAWERTNACTCSGILVNKSSQYRSSTGTGFVLPTRSHNAWLEVVGFPEWWSCHRSCCFPTVRVKSHDTSELTTPSLRLEGNVFEARAPSNQLPCNPWVTPNNHRQCVCPTRPERWGAPTTSRSQPNASQKQKASKQFRPHRGDMWRILHRHSHTAASCL